MRGATGSGGPIESLPPLLPSASERASVLALQGDGEGDAAVLTHLTQQGRE